MAAFGQFSIKPRQKLKNVSLKLLRLGHSKRITATYIISNQLQEEKYRVIIVLISFQSFNVPPSIPRISTINT
jgi:hypothetical protein